MNARRESGFRSMIRALCLISSLLIVFLIIPETYGSLGSFGGMALTLQGPTELINPSLYFATAVNGSLMITVNSGFKARGNETAISAEFYKSSSNVSRLIDATADIDSVWYYTPEGHMDIFVASFGNYQTPASTTVNGILYQISLANVANHAVDYLLNQGIDLSVGDVWYGGTLNIHTEFPNSTGTGPNIGYLRFTLNLNGNMSSVYTDFTIPEEYDITTAMFGTKAMTKIFPNRVATSLSVNESQPVSSEVYMEWVLPVSLPTTPWWNVGIIDTLVLGSLVVIVDEALHYIWRRKRKKAPNA